jgi:hypothetical protein
LWQTCSCGFMRFLLLTASTSKTAAEPVSFQPRHRPRFNGVLPRVQLRWIIHVLPLAAAASPEVFATGRDAMRGRLQNVHEIGAREVLPSLRDACRDQFIGYRALDKDDQLTDAPDGRATIRHARDAKVHFGTDRWHCGR